LALDGIEESKNHYTVAIHENFLIKRTMEAFNLANVFHMFPFFKAYNQCSNTLVAQNTCMDTCMPKFKTIVKVLTVIKKISI